MGFAPQSSAQPTAIHIRSLRGQETPPKDADCCFAALDETVVPLEQGRLQGVLEEDNLTYTSRFAECEAANLIGARLPVDDEYENDDEDDFLTEPFNFPPAAVGFVPRLAH